MTHAGFPEKKMGRMRKRVKKGFKDEEKTGITFGEFMVRGGGRPCLEAFSHLYKRVCPSVCYIIEFIRNGISRPNRNKIAPGT